ncbi:secreted protein [Streptomyces azureus]|uniref:Secreted protein n=2 Tax=Streptomyces azureus TaxID=146537 RepID=A0A0K8Q009_STRAJ|nr:secreted protein [Streptomyces azureus]
MQRRAQRDRDQRAKRLHRVLVCAAAVPVMLVAAGCSSDSGSGDSTDTAAKAAASASASPSPTVQAAAYGKLPEPCKVLSKKTLKDLVPAGKSGKEGKSDDISTRGNCSWNSLDNNGVKGSQFRWLNVSMLRFESDVTRGPADKLAQEYFEKQVQDAQAMEGAKSTKSEPVPGTGDEATAVRYELKKKEGTFKQQTVVARVENVVVTIDFNGAGLAGDKSPSADDLMKDAKKAAKEAVAAVSEANGAGGGKASGAPSESPSKSASKDASDEPSDDASKSPSKKPASKS